MTLMQPANANRALAAVRVDGEAGQSVSPSQFRDTVTLQSLVAPVNEDEFRARYWERKPLIVHRENSGYYGDLFSLQDFDDCTTRGRGYVKTAEATAKVQAKHHGATATALERVLTDMRDGHTLILDGMQEFEPKLGQMCRMLGQEIGGWIQTNIYLTPPGGKGFTPHWDNHDVFILQVLGSKHWKVEKDRRVLPLKDGVIEDEGREIRGDIHSFTLKQGDMIYIPRGCVHAAECGSEPSMHVTMGVYPDTWDQLIGAAVKAAILRDDSLRLALPLGYLKGDGAGIIKRLGEVLRNAADPEFLAQILEQFKDEVVQKARFDISGQITSFFQPKPLTLDDKVGPRAGLVYRMYSHDEAVTLKVGTRAITCPDFFGEALKFALATPGFTIRDLPGDLEDDERLIFIERLMQEALIVRI
jgi:ribosomal protein L16 Arg81 hydroxylase